MMMMMMMMRMRQAGTSQTAFGFSKCQTNYSNTSELPVVPCFNHCKITSFSMTLMANRQPLPPVPPLHTSFDAARNARRTHRPPGQWEVTYFTSHLVSLSKKPIHPRKLTWNLKRMVSKRNLLFQRSIFRFHVSFRGSTQIDRKIIVERSW